MDIRAELGEAKSCVQSFGSGCLDEVNKYRMGVQQLVTGKSYEPKQSDKHGAALAAEKAGGFVVDAAVFIGAVMVTNKLLMKSAPLVERVAPGCLPALDQALPKFGLTTKSACQKLSPLLVGGELGFIEPLKKGEGGGVRIGNALTGTVTVGILEHMPKMLTKAGMENGLASNTGKILIASATAGATNTQLNSLIRLHHFASMSDTANAALSYAAVGGAMHGVSLKLGSKWQSVDCHDGKPSVTVLGKRFDPQTFETAEFLEANGIRFKQRNFSSPQWDGPKVVLPDGSLAGTDNLQELAGKLGIQTKPDHALYDTVVIGGGPAGIQTATNAASEGLETAVIALKPGGQAGTTSAVENFFGFQKVSGRDLLNRAIVGTKAHGTEIVVGKAETITQDGSVRTIKMNDGNEVQAAAVVVAPGITYRKLSIPGHDDYLNKGIYYGAGTTEAPSTRGENVVIVGGANSAGQAAMNFSKYAAKVHLVIRGDSMEKSMSQYLIDQIRDRNNIVVHLNSEIKVAEGSKHRLEAVQMDTKIPDGVKHQSINTHGMFVFIGGVPNTEFLANSGIMRDPHGFIVTGSDVKSGGNWPLSRDPLSHETSIPGVFAAGDARLGQRQKRIAAAVGDGANVIGNVHDYLATLPDRPVVSRGQEAAQTAADRHLVALPTAALAPMSQTTRK